MNNANIDVRHWIVSRCKRSAYTVLTITALAISSIAYAITPPPHEVAALLAVIQMLVVLVITYHPTSCLLITLLLEIIASHQTGGNILATYATISLALGLIAYEKHIINTVISYTGTYIVGIGMDCWNTSIDNSRYTLFTFIIITSLPGIVGYAARWQHHKIENIHTQEKLRHQAHLLQHDETIANTIHDSVTGELSLIARTAQRQMHLGLNNDNQPWTEINEWATNALTDIHRLIDSLDGDASYKRLKHNNNNFIYDIRSIARQGNDALVAAGINGRVNIQTFVEAAQIHVDSATATLVIELLREIFTNITRHASCQSEYEISILINSDNCTITQINTTEANDSHKRHKGHGLRYFQRLIEKNGGTMTYGIHISTWTLYAIVPLRP